MEKAPGRLQALFLDLDGSLLDSRRQVGAQDRETIARLLARGVRVCIATGLFRTFPGLGRVGALPPRGKAGAVLAPHSR